jgi:ABC-type branched-subunit amino acid transport system ATPase component/ABC-type branched-subunit amino acid transport system permease subunit
VIKRRRIRAHHVIIAWLIVYFPWLPGWPLRGVLPNTPYSWVVDANLAAEYALIAFSLVILTGWVGQISLGQGAFVGIGAFTTGFVSRRWGVPFPVSLPIVAVVSAAVATALGVVALRVRGLYLAVATLIFAWMADAYLFSSSWFVGPGGTSAIDNRPIGHPGSITLFDLSKPAVLYVVLIAVVATAWYCAVNLRDSKTGRAFFAIRGSETAAVSLGVDVNRYKLLAFALSGALAGIAGNLIMVDIRAVTAFNFQFTTSLFYVGVAVIGGISSLGGAAAAALMFGVLSEIFFNVQALEGWLDVVTIGLLLAVLVGYPGGLGALGPALLTRFRALRARRSRVRRAPAEGSPDDVSAVAETQPARFVRPVTQIATRSHAPRDERPVVLDAKAITVRFGGLTAVDDVSLSVAEHEIVGLIGPNGAGKTTLFNAIAGFNSPTAGRIELFGRDVTDLPVHRRAALGIGRTFQLIQLFPQLTVFDNLLVATHVHNPTGVFSHLALSTRAINAEWEARDRVRRVVELLGLAEIAGRRVAGLPFGLMRRVEIARAIVTEAPLLMLDEPASGLDNTETDELMEVLAHLRSELGVAILLIEHDVRMVTGVSDFMYVVNRGRLLAQGTPSEVQRNPEVARAYLGGARSETALEPA